MTDATQTKSGVAKPASQRTAVEESSAQPPRKSRRRIWIGLALLALAGGLAWKFWPRDTGPEPVAPVAKEQKYHYGTAESATNLATAIEMAHEINRRLLEITDYTGRMTKRERVGGNLLPQEEMQVKIREQPFSVYVRHTGPESKAGQEAIYVHGQNDNELIAHAVGFASVAGRLSLDPAGRLAMWGNLHPITDIGLRNLIRQLLEMAEKKRDYLLACHIEIVEDAELNGRPCRKLYLRSQAPSQDFRMAVVQIFFDKEWQVPVHYEAYDFPPGDDDGEPILMEQYTWHDLKFNVGLTAADFDPDNPSYEFP